MSFIAEWMRQPQKVWIRRAIFQVHLWLGIGLGLYILMISITGSAIVARRELTRAIVPDSVPILASGRISDDQLRLMAQQLNADYQIKSLAHLRRPRGYGPRRPVDGAPRPPPTTDSPVLITMERAGIEKQRLFDPYTGRDIGSPDPWQLELLNQTVDLHDNLLGGRTGRLVNGVAATALCLLVLTGLVVWWPGSKRWKQGLYLQPGVAGRTQLWQLHSMMGFWLFLMLLLWGLTGIYFAFPEPFQYLAEWIYPPENDSVSRAEGLLSQLVNLHFGRFGGAGVRTAWIVLGLVPAVLFVTGAILWWNSVIRPRLAARRRREA